MLDCPPAALLWASLGYRLGLVDGAAETQRRIGEAGRDVIAGPEWKATIRRRPFDEVKRCRGEA